jgi:ubiquinone/menaquinone biosynthesis C-methylase UbiE
MVEFKQVMPQNLLNQKQKLFDLWAPSYDWLLPSVFYQAIHQRLLEYVQLSETPTVLDLGCGTGRLLRRLATQFSTLQGTGLDLSAEMLHQAQQGNNCPRLTFVQGNAETLPFAETQFEAVFSTFSFLHYLHPEEVFSEVSRVLKSGGRFYLVDFTIGASSQHSRVRLPWAIQFYSREERKRLGETVGLRCHSHHHLLGPVLLTIFEK